MNHAMSAKSNKRTGMGGNFRPDQRRSRNRRTAARTAAPGSLSGSHLLTIPRLDVSAERIHFPRSAVERKFIQFFDADPRSTPKTAIQDYLARYGISPQDYPLSYDLFISEYDYMCDYSEDDFWPDRSLEFRQNYLALSFIAERCTLPLGTMLLQTESAHPGLGRRLLARIDCAPVPVLTPRELYDEPEQYLNWEWNGKDWIGSPGWSDNPVSPERFRAYYPEWAYCDRAQFPAPDDYSRPEWKQILKPFDDLLLAYNQMQKDVPDAFINIIGGDAHCGVLTWIDRDETADDPGQIAFDEEYDLYMNGEGRNAGCCTFEFVFQPGQESRNELVKKSLDVFLKRLVNFDRLVKAIQKGVFL